ncbi:MAG: hypothetical protein AB8I08_29125 [Sandaracinaceae bacterium]
MGTDLYAVYDCPRASTLHTLRKRLQADPAVTLRYQALADEMNVPRHLRRPLESRLDRNVLNENVAELRYSLGPRFGVYLHSHEPASRRVGDAALALAREVGWCIGAEQLIMTGDTVALGGLALPYLAKLEAGSPALRLLDMADMERLYSDGEWLRVFYRESLDPALRDIRRALEGCRDALTDPRSAPDVRRLARRELVDRLVHGFGEAGGTHDRASLRRRAETGLRRWFASAEQPERQAFARTAQAEGWSDALAAVLPTHVVEFQVPWIWHIDGEPLRFEQSERLSARVPADGVHTNFAGSNDSNPLFALSFAPPLRRLRGWLLALDARYFAGSAPHLRVRAEISGRPSVSRLEQLRTTLEQTYQLPSRIRGAEFLYEEGDDDTEDHLDFSRSAFVAHPFLGSTTL